MDLQHLNVKVFVASPGPIDLEPFIGIFNNWIQRHLTDDLLIDVADYRHTVNGPGVVLIGHAANYSLDQTDGRLGLLYSYKAALIGSIADRLCETVRATLLACRRLEHENGLKFNGSEVQLTFNDRLLAPNTPKTLEALRPALQESLERLYGQAAYTLNRISGDPRERLTLSVKSVTPITVTTLLQNLAAERVPA